MDAHENRDEGPASLRAESAQARSGQSLDDAALDLVQAASEGGLDAVVKTLLRSLVALGLTSAASYWRLEEGADTRWSQHRGFGGPTPPPTLDSAEGSPSPAPFAPGSPMAFWFGPVGAIVALRETFDRDGGREQREDELESLVLLAGTLLGNSHDYPSSRHGKTEGKHGTSNDLPGPLPETGKGRQAG